MYNSIQHFVENDTTKIKKFFKQVINGEKDLADLSNDVLEMTTNLAKNMVCEMINELDDAIRNSANRKKRFLIEKRNEKKEILDSLGNLCFYRTGYIDKITGEYTYLVDLLLGLEPHQRITIGAMANILEETIDTSYSKGGKAASLYDNASKQTVKRLVHSMDIDMPLPENKNKKKQKYLYIVADEDHVSAQFWNKKGDLEKNSVGDKINTIMPKLIVLYEDIINESGEKSENPRYRLVGKRVFSGLYKGETENIKLWEKVREYIVNTYDIDELKRVYIAGDGGAWIKAGTEIIEHSKFVLDRFHMMKYINGTVAHLNEDDKKNAKERIWKSIDTADKEVLKETLWKIMDITENEKKIEEISKAYRYLRNNWDGIKIQVEERETCGKCCAEGQVSHILSSRMSSRPMGWSELGCDKMAKLRALKCNGEKVIDLLRYQKEKRKLEEKREEQEKIIKQMRKNRDIARYTEKIVKEVPGIGTNDMKWMRDIVDNIKFA